MSSRKIDYDKVDQLYQAGWYQQDIAKEVGCVARTIGKILNKLGYNTEEDIAYRHSRKPSFFRRVNKDTSIYNKQGSLTCESAYILGLLAGDGNLSSKKRYCISFTSEDKEIVEFFCSYFDYKPRIERTFRKSTGEFSVFQVRLHSKTLYKELINLQLAPNKSKTLFIPFSKDSKLFRFWLLGYTDADGCFLNDKRRKKGLRVSFTSNCKQILEDISFYLDFHNKVGANQTWYNLQLSGTKAYCFRDFIYQGDEPCYNKKKHAIAHGFYKSATEYREKNPINYELNNDRLIVKDYYIK